MAEWMDGWWLMKPWDFPFSSRRYPAGCAQKYPQIPVSKQGFLLFATRLNAVQIIVRLPKSRSYWVDNGGETTSGGWKPHLQFSIAIFGIRKVAGYDLVMGLIWFSIDRNLFSQSAFPDDCWFIGLLNGNQMSLEYVLCMCFYQYSILYLQEFNLSG